MRWLLAALVLLASGAVFYDRAARVGYNVDEGQAIWPSVYFRYVFLEGKLGSPTWDANYWTLTQPPIYRYIIGASIWAHGLSSPPLDLDHRADEVRGPDRAKYFDPATYRNERRLAEGRQVPRPSPELLWAGRVPMVVLGAGAAMLLFLVVADLAGGWGGLVGGVVAATSFTLSPFVQTLIPRAHTEAPFLFFLLLAVWLAIHAARASASEGEAGGGSRRSMLLGALAGLSLGLSASSKLTGVLALAACGAFALGAFGLAPLARRGRFRAWVGPASVLGRAWRWSLVGTVVGLAVFLAVNPFLWPNPVERTWMMLQFRQQEMFGQRTLNAELAVPENIPYRLWLTVRSSVYDEPWAGRRYGIPLEAVLAAAGSAVLVLRIVQRRAAGGLVSAEAILGVSALAVLVGTGINLGINWDRYYLPTTGFALVLAGLGAGALVDWLLRLASSRRAPTTPTATPPPMPTASSGSAG